MSKKILSAILSVVMLVSLLSVAANAVVEPGDGDITDYPVILVPGYSGSDLNIYDEDGNCTKCWGFDPNEIIERVLKRIVDIGKGLVLTAKGSGMELGKTVGEEAVDMLGDLACNPDGTSKYDVRVAYPTAAQRRMTQIIEDFGENTNEPELFKAISDRIGEENCFFFQSDWRMSAADCAADLDKFIQEVKELTGKDKVNLVAVSHGGQVSAVYLSLYGCKKDVDNAVLTVPAAGGAALAYDIMSGNVKLNEYTLIYFIQHGMVSADDYKWLVRAQELGFLDDVLAGFVPYAIDIVGYFPSIWDFIPLEYYEDIKALRLDPTESAALIEKSDYVHYEIMAKYDELLGKCVDEYGINVSIIAGTDHPSVTGLQENSDAIITVNDSTGATCAPFGERYNDGYKALGTTCSDPSHDHVSPAMTIDASTSYLPENTWFVEELFHGMTFLDDYTLNLALTTLLTDRIVNVYSDPDYPQFHVSTNANNCIYARFDNSEEGCLSGDAEKLIITNISKEYPVQISSILFSGCDLTAGTMKMSTIQPGESISYSVNGRIPAVSDKLVQVRIDYFCEGRIITPNGSRTFNFEIKNGAAAEFDEENPLVPADFVSSFESIAGSEAANILTNVGIIGFVEFIFNWFISLIKQFGISEFLDLN